MGDGAQQATNLSDDVNPYTPPTSPSSTIDATRRRTRWRIGVVTLLLIFGSVGLVATPIPLLVAYSRPAEFGGGITMEYFGFDDVSSPWKQFASSHAAYHLASTSPGR